MLCLVLSVDCTVQQTTVIVRLYMNKGVPGICVRLCTNNTPAHWLHQRRCGGVPSVWLTEVMNTPPTRKGLANVQSASAATHHICIIPMALRFKSIGLRIALVWNMVGDKAQTVDHSHSHKFQLTFDYYRNSVVVFLMMAPAELASYWVSPSAASAVSFSAETSLVEFYLWCLQRIIYDIS